MEAVIHHRTVVNLTRHFVALEKHVPLRPIRTAADYDAAVHALNWLLDAGAAEDKPPLAHPVATIGELIADYDAAHFSMPVVAPADLLQHLMEAHELKQSDLPEVGSQGVVSEILQGRRELNLRQIRALAKRFGVPPAVFLREE